MTPDITESLVSSMPRRLAAVIDDNGGATKYYKFTKYKYFMATKKGAIISLCRLFSNFFFRFYRFLFTN